MKGKLIIGIILLGLAGLYSGYYLFNKKVSPLTNVQPDFVLTANELFNDFDRNEQAALEMYEGKVIMVTGKVIGIKNKSDRSNIILEADNAMAGGINCSLNSRTDHIKKGQTTSVVGRCQGYLMDVILNNCYAKK